MCIRDSCDAKQIPEEILKRVSAEAMGLPEFDEAAFAAKVEEIQVPENGVLVFVCLLYTSRCV